METKSDQPNGNSSDKNDWENIGPLWCNIAIKNVRRMKQKKSKPPPARPVCEIIFYAGSRPEHYSTFISASLQCLVMHQNAYSSGVTVTQEDVEESLKVLSKLWPSTFQYMHVEGEVGDADQIANDAMPVVAGGRPSEFSREYCTKLPLGDVGTWPSGGIVLAAGGPQAAILVQASQMEVETIEHNEQKFEAKKKKKSNTQVNPNSTDRVRQNIEYAYSVEKLLQLKSWKKATSDCLLVIDVADDPDSVIHFLNDQGDLKTKFYEKMSRGEKADIPPSIIVALLLPTAQGKNQEWATAAQILAHDKMHPGSVDLMLLMQAGSSVHTASCLTSIVRCPVDFSAVCKHMSPFPSVHHAIGFVATKNGTTGESSVGCLVDTTGLGGNENQDMKVYCSYSIYSGPGGYAGKNGNETGGGVGGVGGVGVEKLIKFVLFFTSLMLFARWILCRGRQRGQS